MYPLILSLLLILYITDSGTTNKGYLSSRILLNPSKPPIQNVPPLLVQQGLFYILKLAKLSPIGVTIPSMLIEFFFLRYSSKSCSLLLVAHC
jgi:hypothetical protein